MMSKKNRVLFYSSVKKMESFQTQKFYQIDINLIKNLGYQIQLTNRILDFLFFWKYDLTFIYFYRKGLLPAIISRFFFKKVYFTGGIDDLNKKTTTNSAYIKQKIFFKLCNLFSNKSILVSISDQLNVNEIYSGKLPKNIGLSFHSIDHELFSVRDVSKKECDFTTVVWMESIENVKRKGIDKALYVFKELVIKKEYSASKFYIIGKMGAGTEYLKKIIDQLDLSDKIIFTGSIDENYKIDLLKKSKFYFQLSTFEGFGLAALEALAAKNIIIHSSQGGLKETIKNYGIILNIDSSLLKQMEEFHHQLADFEIDKLDIAFDNIRRNYSNNIRQKNFEIFFTN